MVWYGSSTVHAPPGEVEEEEEESATVSAEEQKEGELQVSSLEDLQVP